MNSNYYNSAFLFAQAFFRPPLHRIIKTLPWTQPMKSFQPLSFSLRRKILLIPAAFLTALFIGLGAAYFSTGFFSEDARFQKLIGTLFEEEVSSDTLTLHYTLANPANYKITAPTPTLGSICSDNSEALALCSTYESRLLDFEPSRLSLDHQIARDSLILYFHTQRQLMSFPLLYEPLSPSLGIQAQLPVLLAEYSFYQTQDVLDYLKLLYSVKPYFESILAYEQEKSHAGYFMSDATLDRIESQCRSFLANPDSSYMEEVFEENLNTLPDLKEEEKKIFIACHKKLLRDEIFPAYELLIDGLEALRGSGNESQGLSAYPGGKQYYQLLFKSETGIYEPVTEVEQRLCRQMLADSKQISLMLKEQPSLAAKWKDSSLFMQVTPKEILTVLEDTIPKDFPELKEVSPEIRTVHPSMQDYLSPAFYLTPPIDTQSPNVIYINEKSNAQGLELFTTLAHEGFPGHLYQTVSFEQEDASPIRYLITNPGYTEGWATYIEAWAADASVPLIQDPAAKDIAHLYALNRSVNLCLYSLLDIGIHYHGWNLPNVTRYLEALGISDSDVAEEIFQYIVENPANYPKYYVGALEFSRLKEAEMKRLGEDFDLKTFHKQVLSIGSVPFPVLKKYLNAADSSPVPKKSEYN